MDKEAEIRFIRDNTFRLIREYLSLRDWTDAYPEDYPINDNWGAMIDPVTGLYHHIDYAYSLQLDRDLVKKLDKQKVDATIDSVMTRYADTLKKLKD